MTFTTASQYEAVFTIQNRVGNPVDLETAAVDYVITTELGGGEELFSADEDSPETTIHPDGEKGTVEVAVDAADVTWTGTVYEELRVDIGRQSVVVEQRSVTFRDVATEP